MSSIALGSHFPNMNGWSKAVPSPASFVSEWKLIRGEIRQMNPIGHPHTVVVDFLTAWSFRGSVLEKLVRIQETVLLPDSDSAPEPDVVWAIEKRYTNHPQGSDVYCYSLR